MFLKSEGEKKDEKFFKFTNDPENNMYLLGAPSIP
jgi:hypothetical protein